MRRIVPYIIPACASLAAFFLLVISSSSQEKAPAPIRFELKNLPFQLQSDESQAKNVPETMAGGVAVFDYNGDGRPDIFFANGADIATMKKSSPKYYDRLFRNDGNGTFTDVTEQAGLSGHRIRCRRRYRRLRQRWPPGHLRLRRPRQHPLSQQGDGTFQDVTKRPASTNGTILSTARSGQLPQYGST